MPPCTWDTSGGLLVALLLALITTATAGEPIRGATPVRVDPVGVPGASPYGPYTTPVLPPAQDPLHWRSGPNVLRADRPGAVEIVLDVPPGFVVYRDQLDVQIIDPADLHLGHPDIPPGEVRLVPGRDEIAREQYSTDVVVRIPARAGAATPGLRTLQLRVRHQGCFQSHCYRPVEQTLDVHVPVRVVDVTGPELDRRGLPVTEPAVGATAPATEPASTGGGRGRLDTPKPTCVVYAIGSF